MRTTATRAAAALAGAALAVTATPALAAEATGTILNAGSPTAVAGTYLVTLKDGTQIDRSRLARRYGGSVGRVFDVHRQRHVVLVAARGRRGRAASRRPPGRVGDHRQRGDRERGDHRRGDQPGQRLAEPAALHRDAAELSD
jgi:hypothetical protein